MTYSPDPAVKNAQSRARRHGLSLSKRGDTFTLRNRDGHTIVSGDLASVAAHIPGHTMAATPPEWEQLIGEHLVMGRDLRPGQRPRCRVDQLREPTLYSRPPRLLVEHLVGSWLQTLGQRRG